MTVRSYTARRLAAFLLTLLIMALSAQAQTLSPRAAPLEGGARSGAELEWRLAFELAFGEGSPYSSIFPSLYDERLSYEVRRAITKDVLDRIVRIALRETGARQIELSYRPGGYKDFPVVPSAQLRLRAEGTRNEARRALNIIGYLAQQTLVIGSRKTSAGNRAALEIIEQSGGRHLAERAVLEKFWRRLAALSPKLGPGFSALVIGGRPGLYIIDSDGDWRMEDVARFDGTIRAASEEFRIETSARHFQVEYLEVGNDWKTDKDGASYLDRLSPDGRYGLRRRLVNRYRPQVERWIRNAFRKYAPQALTKSSAAAAGRACSILDKRGQAALPNLQIDGG